MKMTMNASRTARNTAIANGSHVRILQSIFGQTATCMSSIIQRSTVVMIEAQKAPV